METARGRQSLPFKEKFHMLGDFLNQTTISHESLGELRKKKKRHGGEMPKSAEANTFLGE